MRQRNTEKERKGVLLCSIWVLFTLQVNEYLIVTLIKKKKDEKSLVSKATNPRKRELQIKCGFTVKSKFKIHLYFTI